MVVKGFLLGRFIFFGGIVGFTPVPDPVLHRWHDPPARQNGGFGRNFAYFPLIFRLFSVYGTTSTVFLPTCLWNLPISAYFPSKMVPHLVKNSNMVPICCFSAHMFRDSAYFPPIFHSFSAYFPPDRLPIFCRSCLAGEQINFISSVSRVKAYKRTRGINVKMSRQCVINMS